MFQRERVVIVRGYAAGLHVPVASRYGHDVLRAFVIGVVVGEVHSLGRKVLAGKSTGIAEAVDARRRDHARQHGIGIGRRAVYGQAVVEPTLAHAHETTGVVRNITLAVVGAYAVPRLVVGLVEVVGGRNETDR